MKTIKDLQSDRALVCKQEHPSDAGGATSWYVCMSDGFLLNCGFGSKSEKRAISIARMINAAENET